MSTSRRRTKSEESASASQLPTRYATAKRDGNLLRLKVREVQHSTRVRERRSEFESISSGVSSRSSRIPDFMKERRSDRAEAHQFPPCVIERKTLRFSDENMERDYRIHTAKLSLTPTIRGLSVILVFSMFTGASMVIWSQIYDIAVYFSMTLVSLPSIICLRKVRKEINNPAHELLCSRIYYGFHSVLYFVFSTLFSVGIINFPDTVWTENQIVVLVMTATLSGDYRHQLFNTLYSIVLPLSLLIYSTNTTLEIILRCSIPMFITSVLSLTVLRLVEVQRKNSFYFQRKLKWIKETEAKTRGQRKFLLDNLYPVPVVNSILGTSSNVPLYKSITCSAMCVLINLSGFEENTSKRAIKEAEEAFGLIIRAAKQFGIHKVTSTGLCITFVTGLFGEGEVNLVEVARFMKEKWPSENAKHVGISVGVGRGWLEGGMLEFSKNNFDVFGSALQNAIDMLQLGSGEGIAVTGEIKDRWISGIIENREFCGFEEITQSMNGTLLRGWKAHYGRQTEEEKKTESSNLHALAQMEREDNRIRSHKLTEHEDEAISCPYTLAQSNKIWTRYLGDLRFTGACDENDFQRSLQIDRNKKIASIQIWSVVVLFLLFGYIDYEILKQSCIDFEVTSSWVLLSRYFFMSPVMLFTALAFTLSNHYQGISRIYADEWNIPFWFGKMYAFYTLLRLVMIYGDFGPECHVIWYHHTFLFSEIFQVAIFYVSSVTITPIRVFSQFAVWIVYSIATLIVFHDKMGYVISLVPFFIFNWMLVTHVLFSIFSYSRDYCFRKEYLFRNHLKKGIHDLAEENEMHEKALLSTLSDTSYENLQKGTFSSIETLHNIALIIIELKKTWNFDPSESNSLFPIISDAISKIEMVAKVYKVDVIKANGSTIIALCKKLSDAGEFEDNSNILDRAIQFSFQVRDLFLVTERVEVYKELNPAICIDFGHVSYGLLGTHEFVYDCFGDTVSSALWLAKCAPPGHILASERTFSESQNCKNFEFKAFVRYQIIRGLVSTFCVRKKMDVWAMFSSYAEWFDE